MTQTVTEAADSLEEAVTLLSRSQRIAIMAHVNPDADAIGSVLGLVRGLQALSKDAIGALADPVPVYASFLPGSAEIVTTLPPDPFDLFVAVDSADIERLGPLYLEDPSRFQTVPVLNVDHHRTNPLYGAVNYVEPAASSSSELIYRLLLGLGAPIDEGTATALLFGIVGDTGSFQNGATTPGALESAAGLVERGADNQRVAFQLFEYKTFAAAKLWGEILASVQLDRERHIVFGYQSQEMLKEAGATPDETEGVAEYLRGIEEAEVVMLLKETEEGDIRVSMRSRPTIDVAVIATALDGGGHRQAAGLTLPGPVESARKTLIETFDRFYGR